MSRRLVVFFDLEPSDSLTCSAKRLVKKIHVWRTVGLQASQQCLLRELPGSAEDSSTLMPIASTADLSSETSIYRLLRFIFFTRGINDSKV